MLIGVNADGILVLKKDKVLQKKKNYQGKTGFCFCWLLVFFFFCFQERISTHPFTEICSWASSATTFAFEFGTQTESQKYTFETRQGAIIASTIQTYIDILVEVLKNGEDETENWVCITLLCKLILFSFLSLVVFLKPKKKQIFVNFDSIIVVFFFLGLIINSEKKEKRW